VGAGHAVLKEVDNNVSQIVANPQGILDPTAQVLPNVVIKYYNYLNWYLIKIYNIKILSL
jgi:hypothetical protein